MKNKYKHLLDKIKPDSKVCIYGTDKSALEIFDAIKMNRADVEVKFFINSKSEGTLNELPIYRADNISDVIKTVDTAIAASVSSRFYMQIVLRAYGLKNVILMNDKLIKLQNNERKKEQEQKLKKYKDKLKQVKSVLKHKEDKKLFELLSKARVYRQKYLPKLKKYTIKNTLTALVPQQLHSILNV